MSKHNRATSGPMGLHRDVLRNPDGGVVWVRDWEHNVLVNGLRSLLAALVKGDPQGHALGYWAVGAGSSVWDSPGTAPPDAVRQAYVQLVNEVGRKALPPGSITFLGGGFTNRLEIISSFTTGDVPAGPLREFGLFAGGTNAANSGMLINHRVHPRIDMQPGFTLERTLQLTF
jgi:hypothetical protein